MNIEAKCRILTDIWSIYAGVDDKGCSGLISDYDLAFPFAFGVKHGAISINPLGESLIEACWNDCCAMMGVDPEGTYADYSAWITASPNEEI